MSYENKPVEAMPKETNKKQNTDLDNRFEALRTRFNSLKYTPIKDYTKGVFCPSGAELSVVEDILARLQITNNLVEQEALKESFIKKVSTLDQKYTKTNTKANEVRATKKEKMNQFIEDYGLKEYFQHIEHSIDELMQFAAQKTHLTDKERDLLKREVIKKAEAIMNRKKN